MMTTDQLRQTIKAAHLLQPRTRTLYASVIDMYEESRGRTITTESLEGWRDELAVDLKPQTVNNYLAALKAACRRISTRDKVANPASAVEPVKVRKTLDAEQRGLTLGEAKLLMPKGTALASIRDRALMICGIRTGLRRAELLSFDYERLDRSKRTFKVTLKGGDELLAWLDTESWQALSDWTEALASLGVPRRGLVWRSMSYPRADGSIFVGEGLTGSAYYEIVVGHGRASGLPWLHPHSFRHTFITWCRANDVPDWKIALATGHRGRKGEIPMLNKYTKLDKAVGESLPRIL